MAQLLSPGLRDSRDPKQFDREEFLSRAFNVESCSFWLETAEF
jgi:hypothetical protein